MLSPNLLIGVQKHREIVADHQLIIEGVNACQASSHELLGGFEEAIASV